MTILYRIKTRYSVFGLASCNGRIVSAAPIAKKSIGRRTSDVLQYWHGRGAHIGVCSVYRGAV
jgi:tRNA(Phe) wybutosine-synthesizing methylase Tyw3